MASSLPGQGPLSRLVTDKEERRRPLSWWPGRYSNAYFYPPHSSLTTLHPTSSLLPFSKRKEPLHFPPTSIVLLLLHPPSSSCPTRSFPNMPLAPSYESVYTTLAHNRRTTRQATRPAPRNESCVACVCGTPGSLNTRTQSFLQISRTSDACYLRLVSVGTPWSRWCPAGTHHRTGSMSSRGRRGQSGRRGAMVQPVLLLIPLSNHRRPGRSCSARNGASRLILI